jgi:hypothetical protein
MVRYILIGRKTPSVTLIVLFLDREPHTHAQTSGPFGAIPSKLMPEIQQPLGSFNGISLRTNSVILKSTARCRIPSESESKDTVSIHPKVGCLADVKSLSITPAEIE